MLRKHQTEFKETIDGIVSGSGIRNIYCHVTPGGGKSILPLLAGKLIEKGFADKMMWIAPRLSLIDQAEREFINPYFRETLGHRLQIRASTNENNPCRGLHGFATTYNAAGLDDGILFNEFDLRRYILICDEFHHIQDNSLWHKKIAPLFFMAQFRVMMSGTLERGDGTKIGFMPYKANGTGPIPDLQDKADTKVIRYTREDALRERAIIPLTFHLSDGQASWQSNTGRNVHVASMDRMTEFDASKAIYTALHTEFAEDLLKAGLDHWLSCRKSNPGATCLVVCSDIRQAKRHAENLKEWGIRARFEIATSDESDKALVAIKKMKAGEIDILVTVAMAYEGLSIESISHIICLTRIRSTPWIEQMTARANRIDKKAGPYRLQFGHVFAPSDPLFKQIVANIEAEQVPFLEQVRKQEESMGKSKSGSGNGEFVLEAQAPGGIVPLSSRMTDKKEIILGGPEGREDAPAQTSSEIEANLLEQIESHIRTYSFQNRYNPKKIIAEVYSYFGKKRRDMTIKELKSCLSHVKTTYPMSHIRGTGHRRVPNKATRFDMQWR